MSGADRVSLFSGLAIIGLGVVLLLDQSGDLDLSAGLVGAALAGVAGILLLAGGGNGGKA